MSTTQTSIRLSGATKEKLEWLAGRYNSQTEAIAVAIDKLFQYEKSREVMMKNQMFIPARGQVVRLTSDLMHYRHIFNNSMVEQPEVSVELKAGAILEVVNVYDSAPYAPLAECVTPAGSYHSIPVEQLEPA